MFGAIFFTKAIARTDLPYLQGLAQPETSPVQMTPSMAFTFATVFVGLLLLCAALVLLLPAFRREIEVFALVVLLFPAASDLLGFSNPFARLLLFSAVACLMVGVFNGFVLDNWRLRTRGGASHRFVTPLAPMPCGRPWFPAKARCGRIGNGP